MKIRPILFERWTGLNWNQRTRISESLKSIAARIGKTQLKRYCCSVVVQIDAEIIPGEEAEDISQDAALDMLGNVNLSHFGGHLCENLPIRLVTISNLIEGYLPDDKRALIIPAGGYQAGIPHKLSHSFVLAYADRFHAAGELDTISRVQGAKAVSLMSGDSQFQLQFNNLPADWTCPDGVAVSVLLWVYETEEEIVDRPSRLVQITDLRDPIELPGGFKKPSFIAAVSQPGDTLAFAGALNVFPRLEVDSINQLEQLNVYELEIMRRWLRPDGNNIGVIGAAAGELLGLTTLVIIDPFEAQKVTQLNSGNDWNIWGQLQAAQNGPLTVLARLYEDLAAADFSVQMARDNVNAEERADIQLAGKPIRSHQMTRGELLGIQAQIRSRAEQRQKTEG